mmetsp:Transcript_25071/g.34550  ORF Transcript_25071/g.34550 Transcript_25071/m.34550 type:complete len:205 (+) Transcript_25071:200-814(+)|eukprot:CAMPEP_0196571152 /NCGR_PEP_ID=MMETSP1081-20130531/1318_1 /TAXON_ID=36882 /ORGANISM="Pyramimonas amylifera, Strain CCMP720" /LENGTH=204 /DNA_ID=CAMNT_0041887963 /DNA_START=200 /DNA_END=814 /DNA_ORIENTATION=-
MLNSSRLLDAAAEGNETVVEGCLAARENPNIQDSHGTTPLIAASTWGFASVVCRLLQAGAALDVVMYRNKWTALHAAASQGHGKVVMLLLQAGADPLMKDAHGRSSADMASASQAIWPFFEAQGCKRTTSDRLRQLGLLVPEFKEGGEPSSMLGIRSTTNKHHGVRTRGISITERPMSRGDVLERDTIPQVARHGSLGGLGGPF